jgi:SsrA-binding protein
MTEINNKKAYFNYFIEEEIESGIALLGTEIKSIRKGSVNIKDSYIRIKNNEAYIINMYIAKYETGNVFNHDEYRERKLLLHKKEIKKLKEECTISGYTLIPLKVYIKDSKAKVLIGVCKGKKLYDKRESIKKKDIEKENRQIKL